MPFLPYFSPFRISIGWRCFQTAVQGTYCHREKDYDFPSIDRYNRSTWGKNETLQWMSPIVQSFVHQCFIFPVAFTLDVFNHSFEKGIWIWKDVMQVSFLQFRFSVKNPEGRAFSTETTQLYSSFSSEPALWTLGQAWNKLFWRITFRMNLPKYYKFARYSM